MFKIGFKRQMVVRMKRDKQEIMSLPTPLDRLKRLTEKNKEYEMIYDSLVNRKDADYIWKKWNKIYFEVITELSGSYF